MEPESRPSLVVARILASVLLLVAAYLVLRPFVVPLLWAAILAYVTWPPYRMIRDRSGRPRLAAAGFTLLGLVVIGIPVASLLIALGEQAVHLIGAGQAWARAGARLPEWLTGNPWIGPRISELRELAAAGSTDLPAFLTRFASPVSDGLGRLAGGVAANVFAFGITLIGLYVFYVDGERLMHHARRLAATLFPNTPERFLDDVGSVVRAVVFGLVGTAIIQGVAGGVGLALFGVPYPVALGALTALLSFIPMGPPLVWGGAAIWLAVGAHTGAAIGMAIWGLLLVSSVDNVLRPMLISRSGSIEIPFLVVFFGVLGGLAAFGLLGLFLGPVLLSVSFTLLAEFPPPHTGASAEA